MISPAMLPRDANGLVCGAWRLVHKSETFSGELGVVPFRNGLSVNHVAGHALSRLAAVYGHVLFMELVEGVRMPEGYSAKVPESFLAKLERCPWRVPAPAVAPEAPAPAASAAPASATPADVLDAMARDDLIALADLHDIDIDRRWGEARLRAALRSAGVTE